MNKFDVRKCDCPNCGKKGKLRKHGSRGWYRCGACETAGITRLDLNGPVAHPDPFASLKDLR